MRLAPFTWLRPLVLSLPVALAFACADGNADTDSGGETDVQPVDADNDGFDDTVDCDDNDPDINPDADEVCDTIDNDCDGNIDDADDDVTDASTFYADTDSDGFGDPEATVLACVQPDGYLTDNTDCDDAEADNYPGNTEVCDGIDNDCDELVDAADPDATDPVTWYQDSDKDGFGDASVNELSCDQPDGYVLDDSDCDDTNDARYPGNAEICDTLDNDCDDLVDDADDDVVGQTTWYADSDGDTLGDADTSVDACFQPAKFVTDDTDCDDTNVEVGGPLTWYQDSDGDEYGGTTTRDECEAPTGYIAVDGDCDDSDDEVNPGATEVCDSKDNDCDTKVDDDDSDVTGTTEWYLDDDGDGFGDEDDTPDDQCTAPTDHVDDDTDCDDANKAVNPDMPFDFDDDVDNDCDDSIDEDVGSETYTHDDDIQSIWNSNCTSCHGSSGGLSLSSSAHGSIVSQASGLTGYDLVEPGLPDDSFLFRKVEGTHTSIGGTGRKMGSLSSSDLSKIETWIEEGAVK